MGIHERKERERESRKIQIMASAKKIFFEKGFSKATMEDIALEAELSPGTLYLYFKNKDELYASLSLTMLQQLNVELEKVETLRKDLNPDQKIDAVKEAMYNLYNSDPLILINLFHLQSSETLKNLSVQVVNDIMELSRQSLGTMARIFEDGIQKKYFIDKHPFALADILWSLFSGILLWEESKKIIDDEKDYIRQTMEIGFEIFCRGIKR